MFGKLRTKWVALLSSALLLAAILFMLTRQHDLDDLFSLWRRTNALALFIAIFLMLIAQVAVAWRLLIIAAADGVTSARFLPLVRIQLISQFVAHGAPISAISDIAKAAMVKLRFSLPTGQSIRIILYERICGALGTVCIGLVATLCQLDAPTPAPLVKAEFLLWGVGLLGVGALIVIGGRQVRTRTGIGLFDRMTRTVILLGNMLRRPAVASKLLLIAFAQLAGLALVFIVLAWGLHIPVSSWHIALFIPLIFFVSSLPIFYQGWGGREAIVLATLGGTGALSDTEAVALSVAFGVVVFLASLPGAIFWMMRPSMRKGVHLEAERDNRSTLSAGQ